MIRTQIKPEGLEYGVSTFAASYDPERRVMTIIHNGHYEEWDIAAFDEKYARTHENPAKSRSLSPDLAVSRTNTRKGEQK